MTEPQLEGTPRAARPVEPLNSAANAGPVFPKSTLPGDQAAADIGLATVVIAGFLIVSRIAAWPLMIEAHIPEGSAIYLPSIVMGLFCLITIGVLLRRRGQTWSAIGLGRARVGLVLLGALIAVPVCYFAGAVTNVLITLASGGNFVSFARERSEFLGEMSNIPLGWVFPISIFVGVYEEILFRGFLLTRLRALATNDRVPIILSSILFGAGHNVQGVTGMFQTAVIGLILAIMAVRLRTIWAGILAHAAIDSISLAVTVLLLPEMQEMLQELTTVPAS